MGTWSISGGLGDATISADTGEAFFPSNSSSTQIHYTIQYVSDEGCTATTVYTVRGSGDTMVHIINNTDVAVYLYFGDDAPECTITPEISRVYPHGEWYSDSLVIDSSDNASFNLPITTAITVDEDDETIEVFNNVTINEGDIYTIGLYVPYGEMRYNRYLEDKPRGVVKCQLLKDLTTSYVEYTHLEITINNIDYIDSDNDEIISSCQCSGNAYKHVKYIFSGSGFEEALHILDSSYKYFRMEGYNNSSDANIIITAKTNFNCDDVKLFKHKIEFNGHGDYLEENRSINVSGIEYPNHLADIPITSSTLSDMGYNFDYKSGTDPCKLIINDYHVPRYIKLWWGTSSYGEESLYLMENQGIWIVRDDTKMQKLKCIWYYKSNQ